MAKKSLKKSFSGLLLLIIVLISYFIYNNYIKLSDTDFTSVSLDSIPEYSGVPYVKVEDNVPEFSEQMKKTESYEKYGELDSFGRCTVAYASIGRDIMPTEERGEIGQIKPSGWQTVKYDIVDGKYLYNRCHLIGYQLTGENANEKNLITGTRYMNVDGMLPFENMVADYIKETGNHVAYRVTPIYEGDNPVASGVQMEAYSIEDEGEGICFNVYCYNVQPGIEINYATGESKLSVQSSANPAIAKYVINKNNKKFHTRACEAVESILEKNKSYSNDRAMLIAQGYKPCGSCKP